jgi:transcriptional regulator with XRE-family HTH domain
MITIGSRLKTIREILKLNQKDFGEPINIGLQNISKYERDEVKPSYEALEKITNQYKINLNYLVTGMGEMFLGQEPVKKIDDKKDRMCEAFDKLDEERKDYYHYKIIAESME